jgi:hypothetical protein
MMRSFFAEVPLAVVEAAQIDGASHVRVPFSSGWHAPPRCPACRHRRPWIDPAPGSPTVSEAARSAADLQ